MISVVIDHIYGLTGLFAAVLTISGGQIRHNQFVPCTEYNNYKQCNIKETKYENTRCPETTEIIGLHTN